MKSLVHLHNRIMLGLLGIDAFVRLFIRLCHLYKYVGAFV